MKGGFLHYDTPVGILCLDTRFAKPRGHMRNPRTYPFPTVSRVITGVDVQRLLFHPTPDMLAPFLEAALELQADGVLAVTGSCGFMARFQEPLSRELRVPVLLSSLVQLPLLRVLHGPAARLGVLTASAAALTAEHVRPCGVALDAVLIRGMEGGTEFRETILEGQRQDLDMPRLQGEVVDAARAFVREEALDALLLECTDLSAFAPAVQRAVGLPVYDINTLVEYAAQAVCRREYQ